MADDGAYTADDPTLTVGPKIVCTTELCDQQPSATTSTLQVEADQRTLDLAPLLSLCPNDELLEAPVGILQECDYPSTDNVYMVDDNKYTTKDDAVDDPTLTVRPKIVCAISELRDQQPTRTTLTSADFRVLDELTEDLLVAAVQKSLNVPPLSLCPNEEQSNSISRDDDSVTSSEMAVPWIIIPSVLDKLLEFDEVSSEIKNADTKYGKHLPPLPLCLASAPEETQLQPCESSAVEISSTKIKSVVTEQLDSYVAPVRIQLLDALADVNDFVPDEAAESTTIVPIVVAKSDGDGLEPATTTIQVKSAVTEQLDSYVAPVRIQLLDALADVNDFVPDEATESTTIVPIVVDKSDGDGLEPAMTTTQVKSAVTEQLDSYVAPVRIQLLDALADVNDFVPDEATESTTIVPIVVDKSDGDGLEPAMTTTQVKSAVTEQLDSYVAPVRIQLLDALADVNDFVPDEATESTTIVPIAVAKSDGDGLEPATTAVQAKSAAAEKPRQGRRRSFLSAVGRRLLKFGRTLCCCCCCK
ncbi:uncharacterized protein LOC132946609 [Metopolophium dirhodum]|uniref:uncharacterized protein LOC132946607 n=1 Tax=Metopolophium dirhodum TaxID=44670 RepID=UPI00298F5611|nr:uncharacterized protein LOC132946607 [Metopolophium dirhodum]XP_060872642.1 uncharacterized protein LOC132946609 [Metopolophium dirhodum]